MFENSEQQTDNKIMLLYVLSEIDMPVTDLQLNNIMMTTGLANYFTLQLCLGDMVEKKLVDRVLDDGGIPMYAITQEGKRRLGILLEGFPISVKRRITKVLKAKVPEVKKETEVNSSVFRDEEGKYYIRCYIREGINYIADIKFLVGSKEEADKIALSWKKDTSRVYTGIMMALYGNEEQ